MLFLFQPPENELMKGSERKVSDAELRIRRSLQRLDVPEWMKQGSTPQQGFLLRRRDSGNQGSAGGWSAMSSKTGSMTSLGSSRANTPNTPTKVVIPTRVSNRSTTGVMSPSSTASISPSPSDRSSMFQYPMSRWSTSRLNSGTTTPTGSITSQRTSSYSRQPYLGWRSQTSLASLAGSQSSLTNSGSYLTAAERLALGISTVSHKYAKITGEKENDSSEANTTKTEKEVDASDLETARVTEAGAKPEVSDVHSSIKEVTSAIVHYCTENSPKPSPRSSPRIEQRPPSPRKLVWVESSFVGTRPITSPETPTGAGPPLTPTEINGHEDDPEVTEKRPQQPPGEYLMAW